MIAEKDLECFKQFILSFGQDRLEGYQNWEFLYCGVFKEDLLDFYDKGDIIPLRVANLIQYFIEIVLLNDLETAEALREYSFNASPAMSHKILTILTESPKDTFHRYARLVGDKPENN